MSTSEELQRDCAYCRQPITLKWKNGPMRSEGVRLVVDQFFHDQCWDKFFAVYNGKRDSETRSASAVGPSIANWAERSTDSRSCSS
jgi:hypothetical protein